MDVLSEVLRVVRLSGVVQFSAEFTEPWAFASTKPDLLAARLNVQRRSIAPFHIVVEGSCWVMSGRLAPVRMQAGDVILLPHGNRHVMASGKSVMAVPIADILGDTSLQDIAHLKYGGSGQPARFICGYLHFDRQFDTLLNGMPPLLGIRSRGNAVTLETWDTPGRSRHRIEHKAEAEWWQASLRYLIGETGTPGPGNGAVLARLAESLFIAMLRWQLRYGAEGRGGWLAGLHDVQIGRVLKLLHESPEHPWTVDELAKAAAISRATLAKRFVDLVGQSPIHYLAGWRMHLARQLLRDSELGIGAIAGRVGYDSEAAFSRAFRRHVGAPPAAWRRAEDYVAAVGGRSIQA